MAPPPAEEWDTSLLSGQRRARLKAAPPFEDLADEIAGAAKVISAWLEPYWSGTKDQQKQCAQVIYRIAAPSDLFDCFYNGSDGLRGRYWQSASAGDAATRAASADQHLVE